MNIFNFSLIIMVTWASIAGAWAPNSKLNDVEPAANQRGPDLFVDEDGVIHAVWVDYRDQSHVYYTRSEDGGANFGSNIKVSNVDGVRAERQQGPAVYARNEHIYVTWNNTGDNIDVYIAHSDDDGQSWTDRRQVNHNDPQNQFFHDLAVDSEGRVFVTWLEFPRGFINPGYIIARSEDQAESFDNYLMVNEDAPGEVCDCCSPDITIDDHDRIFVSWRNNDDNIRDVYLARSVDNGESFENPVNVHANNWRINSCPSTGPSLRVAGDMVYVSWLNGVDNVWRVFFGVSEDGGESFNDGRIINHLNDPDVIQNFPEVALGREGDVWVTWQDDRHGNNDIFTALSRNYGETFSYIYRVNDDEGNAIQESPVGAAGPDGEYCIIWLDRRQNSDDIYFAAERFRLPEWTRMPFESYETDENELIEFDFSVDGALADSLTFTLVRSNLPDSARLVDNGDRSGYFSWTPELGDAGNYEFAIVLSNGEIDDSIFVTIEVMEVESVIDDLNAPVTHTILTAYPNPFNSMIRLDYNLPQSASHELTVYNLSGELVSTLTRGFMPAGRHSLEWSADSVPAGIYFLRSKAGGSEAIVKVLLVK